MEYDETEFVIRPLRLNDLPFLIALEQASFPANEAATPEKVDFMTHE
jgi:GNAT superfamily N-acetyltransferase